MRYRAPFWLAIVFLVAGACAELPLAGAKYNSAAKRFKRPPMDRANIYVYEASNGRNVALYLDGARVATMDGYTFIVLTVRPGSHTLASQLEWKRFSDPKNQKDAELEIYVGGGLNHFVEMETSVIAGGDVSLASVGSEDGKAGVRKCTLLAEIPPPLPPSEPLEENTPASSR